MVRRRRRRRLFRQRRWPIGVLVILVILLIIADRQGWLLADRADDLVRYDGRSFAVAYVIDGDTIEIDAPDPIEHRATTRVRLWGIDCPEVAHSGNGKGEPWGDEATQFTRRLTATGPVTLHLESHRLRGVYRRILAHVDTADGTRLNEALLDAGLAFADERWPHHELDRYAQAQDRAKQARLGVWSPDQPVPAP